MICENGSNLFPDTCVYKNVPGYAELPGDASSIASVEFTFTNSMKGTKTWVSLTGEVDPEDTGSVTVEIQDKTTAETLGKTVLKASDLKGGEECRVPFFVDRGSAEFICKTTSTLAKGGLYATVKYEVG